MSITFPALACLVAASGFALLLLDFFSGERARGRFVRRAEPAVDEARLRSNLFSISPEEAGAAWLDRVEAFQVLAVMARLANEGRLRTHVESSGRPGKARKMQLRLLAPIESFAGYERALLAALFVDGGAETSSDRIAEHYGQAKGRIVEALTPGLVARMAGDPELGDVVAAPSIVRTALLAGVSAVLFLSARDFHGLFMTSLFVWITSMGAWGVAAETLRTAIGYTQDAIFVSFTALWPLAMGAVSLLLDLPEHSGPLPGWRLVGVAFLSLAVCSSVLNAARTRSGNLRNQRRRAIDRAREYLKREARARAGAVPRDWVPYMISLALEAESGEPPMSGAFSGPSSWGWRGGLGRPLLYWLAGKR